MYKILKFKEVKELLTPTDVVKKYLGLPKKTERNNMWYISPFRQEKTASFCVSDNKGIHDFGDSTHYDIISFTSKLFGISNPKALNLLIQDFNLPIENDTIKEKEYAKFKRTIKEQKEREIKYKNLKVNKVRNILKEIKIYENIIENQKCNNICEFDQNNILPLLYKEISQLEYKLYVVEISNVEDFFKEELYEI